MQGLRAEDIAAACGRYTGRVTNLTARLPRSHHAYLKAFAKKHGLRTADVYVAIIDDFIRSNFDGLPHLYAVPRGAMPVTISVRHDLIDFARATADAKGAGANELIFSAIASRIPSALSAVA